LKRPNYTQNAMKRPPKEEAKQVAPPSVPTESDWGDYKSDLDQNHAHSGFAGRTNVETQPLFRENPIEMTDELRWMPEIPFRYYMLGFRDFVMGQDFGFLNAPDAASCFLGLVLEKLEKYPQHILPIMSDLLPALDYVGQHQARFEASAGIYGNFREKLSRIKRLYAAQSGSQSSIK
jgi:hypothetical protein